MVTWQSQVFARFLRIAGEKPKGVDYRAEQVTQLCCFAKSEFWSKDKYKMTFTALKTLLSDCLRVSKDETDLI